MVVNTRKRIPQTRKNVVNGSKVYVLTTDEPGNGNVQTVNHVSPNLRREENEYRREIIVNLSFYSVRKVASQMSSSHLLQSWSSA